VSGLWCFSHLKRKTAPEGLLSRGGPSGAKTLTALSPEGATMEKSEKGGFFARQVGEILQI